MDMLGYLSRYWWTVAVRGAFAVVFGLAGLLWPGITLRVLVWLYGFYSAVDGLLALAVLIVGGRLASGRRGWLILEGVVGIASVILGIYLAVRPGEGAIAVVWAIGLYAIVVGVALPPLGVRLRRLAGPMGTVMP